MKHARDLTGEMPVAQISEMHHLNRLVVASLRAWNAGGALRAHALLCERMAEPMALAAFEALHDLTEALGATLRRPLRCHTPQCGCVGMDEAAFARFVEEAALGDREDALMMASVLVTARGILPLTEAAARFGLCLHRADLCAKSARIPEPTSATRH
ncbi:MULTISPECIES: hypothetical protein [unclassified Roseovarius]|jgi:hypothetical protein|uniref:hypothetical protein n=1 Tax=unclassified Roseovarius TaxID=2614913 RepID=UPI00006867F2|nr:MULTISPECIES: hypothetical protein [unclassified Roseovarius]EAQ23152.1 hypothetical protein ROS217_23860 [Roseovarius sp. 217]KJS41005.1 MAG: hypothetical protein VR71_21240 [Roseovarius sp. BRH_c41]KJS44431.1 MAG: hypothetical protein VR71_05890 [Roseovarius sp. BRH_c41]